MQARIATFEGGRPEFVEIARKYAQEEWLPELRELKGFSGYLQLADAQAGRALSIVLFDSPETLEAGDQELDAQSPPPELSETRRTSVETYEVVLQEYTGEPAAARVSRLEGPADRIDAGIQYVEENILTRARTIEGWTGVFLLADRETGKSTLITLWESIEALQASEETANRLRQESADAMGDTIAGVERYEVVTASIPVRAGIR